MTKKIIAGLKKGVEILDCFDLNSDSLSAKQIAELVSMPQGSIYRYLDTLIDCGLLLRDTRDKKYRLGYRLLQMGSIVSLKMSLADIINPHMNELSILSGETSLVTIRNGWKTICIAKKETNRPIKLSLEIGRSLPLHAGASSKVLIAYEPDTFLNDYLNKNDLIKLTDATTDDAEHLKNQLGFIRRDGYVLANEEVNIGVAAISAPVFDGSGKIAASLTVAGPSERIIENKQDLIKHLIRQARKASIDLGWRKE